MKTLAFMLLASLSVVTLKAQEKEEYQSANRQPLCGGVERWSVKVLTDAAAGTVNFTPIVSTITNLTNLVTPAPSSSMPRYAGIEDKTYKVVCNVTIKKVETDNDYHLVLSDGVRTLIAEVPDPTCSAAAASAYVNQYIAVRNFVNQYIPAGNVYNVSIPSVEITGVAFIDPPHGQTGAAANNIELHPMLHIQFSNVSGINAVQEKLLSVNVSPNPAKESITVNVTSKNELADCSILFFNTMAEKVSEVQLAVQNQTEISQVVKTSSLAPGVYIYRIMSKGKLIFDGKLIHLPND